jgi:hypothetical protein
LNLQTSSFDADRPRLGTEGLDMNFGVDTPKAAIIAIDLHRGHLDMK